MLLVIAIIFTVYAILVLYYGIQFRSLHSGLSSSGNTSIAFSIIIPARNEEKVLPALLTALGSQDHPRDLYEIIVVDDHSTDGTREVVGKFQGVRYIAAGEPKGTAFKKKAIEDGIKAANHKWILCTDADCIPGPKWLSSYASLIEKKDPVFIAAPVQFSSDGSVLGLFQEMDMMILQSITAVVVSKSQMSMCNGANLAYRKQAFNEVNGFEGVDHLASGDDMLLMYKIWQKYPDRVVYLKQKEAIVLTPAQNSWKEFLQQRIRWASKASHYQDKRILPVMILVYLLNLSFPLLFIMAILHTLYWKYFFAFWLTKTLVEWPLFLGAAKYFNRRNLVPLFFFFQPLHIIYTLTAGLLGLAGKYEWKGRRVN